MAHKAFCRLTAAPDAEADHAAGAFRQVFAGQLVVFVAGKPRIADPGDLVAGLEKLRHFQGVGAVALDAHVQAFEAEG